jgi:glyoxylase-like metal-dependent hydrolase (beta-lactamase superfamily II)
MSEVQAFETAKGARIYRMPLTVFPGMVGYSNLVFAGDVVALIDVGSNFGVSDEHLEAGLAVVRETYREKAAWRDITHVLISHGHIDHFGGLRYVRQQCDAPVGVHELDLRVLTNYEERLQLIAWRLREFLLEAGVEPDRVEEIMDLYLINKQLFSSTPVDFTYQAVGMAVGPIKLIHMPGHCPGLVVAQVDDFLLSSDHVLETISPHQAPERLSLNTGLGTYLESLDRLMPLSKEINLTLGGHEGVIDDLAARIQEIKNLHYERLEQVLSLLDEPRTVAGIARELFPDANGYHELLALEEAGAHLEYLDQRAYLQIENIDDLDGHGPVPIRYRKRTGITQPLLIPGMVLRKSQAKVKTKSR